MSKFNTGNLSENYDGIWIDNKPVEASDGGVFDVLNPLDDSLYRKVAETTVTDVDTAIRSAHEAFQTYGKTSAKEREKLLVKAAELLDERIEEFKDILIDEAGSTYRKATFEAEKSVTFLRAAAGMVRQVSGKTLPTDYPGKLSMTLRKPRGVAAVITPFNVPLIKAVRLCANALATGCTVVLLPSEMTPVLALRFAELLADAGFPAGAVNVIPGNGFKIGDSLTTHPLIKAVTFTGSTVVGKHIQKLCAEHNKPVTLELGGKSPLVVLDDANLKEAVTGALRGIFMHQGQACIGSSRVYVEKGVYPKFIEMYAQFASKIGRGDLRDPETIIGPIITPRQRERIKSHIDDAVSKGATVAAGGTWIGNRCEPTILLNVTEEMNVCKEETFGPVVSVYEVDSFEEALAKANDSIYGLSSAIYTSNLHKAMEFANSIEAGMCHINSPTISDEAHVPFGGVGDSGIGREGTEADIELFTEIKWVTIQN
ncbi:aldehyde dehydrogenase family protein [Colwellia sp. RE-S-Sl-9]